MQLTVIPLATHEHAKARMLVAKERLLCHPMMLICSQDPIRVALVGVVYASLTHLKLNLTEECGRPKIISFS